MNWVLIVFLPVIPSIIWLFWNLLLMIEADKQDD